MNPIRQIDGNPLDLAGGGDIESHGSTYLVRVHARLFLGQCARGFPTAIVSPSFCWRSQAASAAASASTSSPQSVQ